MIVNEIKLCSCRSFTEVRRTLTLTKSTPNQWRHRSTKTETKTSEAEATSCQWKSRLKSPPYFQVRKSIRRRISSTTTTTMKRRRQINVGNNIPFQRQICNLPLAISLNVFSNFVFNSFHNSCYVCVQFYCLINVNVYIPR